MNRARSGRQQDAGDALPAVHPSRRRTFAPALLIALAVTLLTPPSPSATAAAADFPPGFEGYHTYSEMATHLADVAAARPGIVRRFSIGKSYQGRDIWAVKVSDNVGTDENEPEVLFDGNTHAREHITGEMAIYLLDMLVRGYVNGDARVRRVVNTREIFIVPMVNPDGVQYDISGGVFHYWRKNRQPNAATTAVGTDINRNYGYHWGCCNGSSTSPSSSQYRGPSAWSTHEARALRDFINRRVVGGRQQIRAAISFHSAGEQVLWPYGYTFTDVPGDMTTEDHTALVALARGMAADSDYTAMQSSGLYVTDGDYIDWAYGIHRIFAYTFELYPPVTSDPDRHYPDDSLVPRETSRNRSAVLRLLENADCPYRASGRALLDCGPLYDDFEIARGWRMNPSGTDTATAGRFERGNPETTSSSGYKQLGTAASGSLDLVTGRLAGASVGTHDVDGGKTSAMSPSITLSGGSTFQLRFRYYFAHSSLSSTADYLRVKVVTSSGATRTVFQEFGSAVDDDAAWTSRSIDLDAYAGQSVRLLVEVADGSTNSLVEVAIDDVRVTRE